MGTSYARALKPDYANDFSKITWLGSQVQRVLSGIVSEDVTSEEFKKEVQIQMQPRPDGGLAIIGWIEREPFEGMPDEQYDEVIEVVPEIVESDKIKPPDPTTQSSPFRR